LFIIKDKKPEQHPCWDCLPIIVQGFFWFPRAGVGTQFRRASVTATRRWRPDGYPRLHHMNPLNSSIPVLTYNSTGIDEIKDFFSGGDAPAWEPMSRRASVTAARRWRVMTRFPRRRVGTRLKIGFFFGFKNPIF
jgi:hypothetical protein